MQERLEAVVFGYVQGVSFRYYTMRKARELGLVGCVSNKEDGSVEVIAEGPRPALNALLQFLHSGSPAAHVDRVRSDWPPATGEYRQFDSIT